MSEMKHICSEIAYNTVEGGVHSDICFEIEVGERFTQDAQEFLKAAFEEFLRNYDGTSGYFHVGVTPDHFTDSPL